MVKKKIFFFLIFSLLLCPIVSARVIEPNETAISYGHMHGYDDTRLPVGLTTIGEYVNFSGLNSSHTNNMNFDGNKSLQMIFDGNYSISASLSISATGSGEYDLALFIDGIMQSDDSCHAHRTISNANVVGSVSLTCIVTLLSGQNVTVAVRDDDAPLKDVQWQTIDITIILIEINGIVERRSKTMLVKIWLFFAIASLVTFLIRMSRFKKADGLKSPQDRLAEEITRRQSNFMLDIIGALLCAVTTINSFDLIQVDGVVRWTFVHDELAWLFAGLGIILVVDALSLAFTKLGGAADGESKEVDEV